MTSPSSSSSKIVTGTSATDTAFASIVDDVVAVVVGLLVFFCVFRFFFRCLRSLSVLRLFVDFLTRLSLLINFDLSLTLVFDN